MVATSGKASAGSATAKPSSLTKMSKKAAVKPTSDGATSDVANKHSKPFGMETSDDDEEDLAADLNGGMDVDDDDDDLMIGTSSSSAGAVSGGIVVSAPPPPPRDASKPQFKPLSEQAAQALTAVAKGQLRKIPIPPHRLTPLKNEWHKIYTPLVEMAGLQVRMNVPKRCVELKSSKYTTEQGMLQKGADFVKAFAMGFEADDAIALLRMDDLFVDTFEIKDVKTLHGDNLSRAIGRIAGKDGRTRFAIENASRTRLVVADTKIHILGNFSNIKIARDAVVALIRGSPPGKVYANLKTIGARQRQRA